MGHMARSVGNIDVGAVLEASSQNLYKVFARGATLFGFVVYTVAANCAPGTKSSVYGCLAVMLSMMLCSVRQAVVNEAVAVD